MKPEAMRLRTDVLKTIRETTSDDAMQREEKNANIGNSTSKKNLHTLNFGTNINTQIQETKTTHFTESEIETMSLRRLWYGTFGNTPP